MSWRPNGWDKIRLDYLATLAKNEDVGPFNTSKRIVDYEAGADAMLEALKGEGSYVQFVDEWEGLDGIKHKPFKGWVLSIPDGEK